MYEECQKSHWNTASCFHFFINDVFCNLQAVVRAMDTITDHVSNVRGVNVSKFMVAGASKVRDGYNFVGLHICVILI